MVDAKPSENGNVLRFISADQFKKIDINKTVADIGNDMNKVRDALFEAMRAAEDKNEEEFHAFRLLAALSSFHFKPDDRATIFGPLWVLGDKRSAQPSDFNKNQCIELGKIAPDITNPSLRGRIGDVIWFNDRSQSAMAEVALDAYCEICQAELAEKTLDADDGLRITVIIKLIHRSLQISAYIYKKNNFPEKLKLIIKSYIDLLRDKKKYVFFEKLVRLAEAYSLISWSEIAAESEIVIASPATDDYPEAVRKVWQLAADAYEKLKDKPKKQNAQLKVVEQIIKMRDSVPSAIAKVQWTRDAIEYLRRCGGFKEKIALLYNELRDFQEQSLDEHGSFKTPMDIGEIVEQTVDSFTALPLSEALREFILLTFPQSVSKMKEQALDSREKHVLGSLFGTIYSDRQGKIIAETDPCPPGETPSEEWFKIQSVHSYRIWRHLIVGGYIEPARQIIAANFCITEETFLAIVDNSPFVPQENKYIFALGFARFMQGDLCSAAYLLIPQLENSFRYVLTNLKKDPAKTLSNSMEEDRSLSGLYESKRGELELVFGFDRIYEIEMLFLHKTGPSLRHEMAHGKLSTGACLSADVIYACWLIYQLTCVPIYDYWGKHIAPEIEATIA